MSAADPLAPYRTRSLLPLVLSYPALICATLAWRAWHSTPAMVSAICFAAVVLADVTLRLRRRSDGGLLPAMILGVLPCCTSAGRDSGPWRGGCTTGWGCP